MASDVSQRARVAAADWSFIECRRCSEYEGDFVADLAGAFDAFAADATAIERERCVAQPRKGFPILGGQGAKVDFQLVADHGKQAQANHYQTVERLAERGGLSWCELHAVLSNRKWQKMDENDAIAECRAIEARYLAAIRKGPTS